MNPTAIDAATQELKPVQQETLFLVRYYNIFGAHIDDRWLKSAPTRKGADYFGERHFAKTSWVSRIYRDGALIAMLGPQLLTHEDLLPALRKLRGYAQYRYPSVIEFFKSESYTMIKRGYAGITPQGRLVPLTDLSNLKGAA